MEQVVKDNTGTDNKTENPSTSKTGIVKKFTERQDFLIDERFDYPRNGNNPGKILIFNYENSRSGSQTDVNNLRQCFFRLGVNIDDDDVCKNLKALEVDAKLNAVLEDKETLSNSNCLIVIFMTHGKTNEELKTVDYELNTKNIWQRFIKCEELRNKPKMFIFQACKGEKYSTVKGESEWDNFGDTEPELLQMHHFYEEMGDDMLIAYSSCEDKVSHRRPGCGSWFIHELALNFGRYGSNEDVISILLRITKCVSTYFAPHSGIILKGDDGKQMPVFISTLSKKFYLIRSKERHEQLMVYKEIEKLKHTMNKKKK